MPFERGRCFRYKYIRSSLPSSRRKVEMTQTVVLSTSNLQRPLFERGAIVKFESYGVLEAALAAGHRVIVCSTRTKTTPIYDAWWIALVGQENVFLADEPAVDENDPDALDAHGRPYVGYSHPKFDVSSGWKKGFAALGIPWPTQENGEPAFWTAAEYRLKEFGLLSRTDLPYPSAAVDRLAELKGGGTDFSALFACREQK